MRMNARYGRILAALLATGWLSGCGLLGAPEYRPVVYYDLGPGDPEPRFDFRGYRVGRWTGSVPSTRRLLLRQRGNALEELEYHAWIQLPAPLLSGFLDQVSGGGSGREEISGEIWRFELDQERKLAWLGVSYQLGNQPAVSRSFRAEWRGDTPADAAAAMADCARQLAAELERACGK